MLEICGAGPNNIPEGCALGTDDVLLGTGGSDDHGSFTIALSRPLIAGEIVFAIDLRTQTAGPPAAVAQGAAIPDVNAWGATALAASLLIGVAVHLRRSQARSPKA